MNSLALANQKGGVGKTTTAIHLAHGLAMAGHSVVLLDLDPQGNATVATQGMVEESAAETAPSSPFAALRPLRDGWWILPSPGARRNLSTSVRPDVPRLLQLAQALAGEGVEWLIADCPPRMDAWGWAGVQICEEVILPVQAEFFAMHGLSQMTATLREVRRKRPGHGRLRGVIVTMVDLGEAVTRDILDNLGEHLGESLFDAVVYRDSRFVEAASHGVTLFDYALDSNGARSYGEVVREVMYGRSAAR